MVKKLDRKRRQEKTGQQAELAVGTNEGDLCFSLQGKKKELVEKERVRGTVFL